MNSCQAASSSPWSNAAVILTALGALVFVIVYAVTTRWWSSAMGKHVMTFMAAILVVTMLAVISIFFGVNWPHRAAIRTGAWGSIAACLWWRVIILFQAQRLSRRDRS